MLNLSAAFKKSSTRAEPAELSLIDSEYRVDTVEYYDRLDMKMSRLSLDDLRAVGRILTGIILP